MQNHVDAADSNDVAKSAALNQRAHSSSTSSNSSLRPSIPAKPSNLRKDGGNGGVNAKSKLKQHLQQHHQQNDEVNQRNHKKSFFDRKKKEKKMTWWNVCTHSWISYCDFAVSRTDSALITYSAEVGQWDRVSECVFFHSPVLFFITAPTYYCSSHSSV